uniref:TM2 domain-containing protein n=1 Tax=viral metagenome TaxID=1070528 RepID=A0A6C0L7E1_9ZZZZ
MGSYTPDFIKEAVAGSHVAVWGEPQYSKFGMLLFTLVFGYFGLHHFMLRSPLTGILCYIVNMYTGGYWYLFDLLQLYETSVDDLNEYGLGSPFLCQFGIAVGMWEGGTVKTDEEGHVISEAIYQRGGGIFSAVGSLAAKGVAKKAATTTASTAAQQASKQAAQQAAQKASQQAAQQAAQKASQQAAQKAAQPITAAEKAAAEKAAAAKAKQQAGQKAAADAKKASGSSGSGLGDAGVGSGLGGVASGVGSGLGGVASGVGSGLGAMAPGLAAGMSGMGGMGGMSGMGSDPMLPGSAFEPPPLRFNTGSGSLADTAGNLMAEWMKLIIGWLLSRRPGQEPKKYPSQFDPASPLWTFLFLLAVPIGPLACIIAGDWWNALFHLNPLIYIYSIIETIYTLLYPMEVFINGVSRPFPFPQIFINIDVDGQSPYIQRSEMKIESPEKSIGVVEPFIRISKYTMALVEGIISYIPMAIGPGITAALSKFANAAQITAMAGTSIAGSGLAAAGTALAGAAKPAPSMPAAKLPVKPAKVLKGGGEEQTSDLAPSDTISVGILAAVLIGGLFLGLGRNVQGKDDSPPLARRI